VIKCKVREGHSWPIHIFFKQKHFWVISVDLFANEAADSNITVDGSATWHEQEQTIIAGVHECLRDEKLDAVLCVAGGWAGGNAGSKETVKNAELMCRQSICSSIISAQIAAAYLKPGGLLQLTGAAPAIGPTPGMLGYGLAKAAVHQLTSSLAAGDSGLPPNSCVLALLPVTLDTPMNRKWMPDADHTTWTPLEYIADMLHQWTADALNRPVNGSLLKMETIGGKTCLKKI